jgi:DNA-3-methyladenine glycosylase
MFGPPGSAYVYRIYGVHWCLNVVTDTVDHPAAVLIRAIEPITGIDVMHERRGRGTIARCLIGRGPGNLARALGIDGILNGQSLRVAPLRLLRGDAIDDAAIATGPRIGVTRAMDLPLRFFIRGNPSVSGRRKQSRPPER